MKVLNMETETLYLIDKNKGYQGNILSTVYKHEDGFNRVAFSHEAVYNNGVRTIVNPDLTVEEYSHKNNIEPLVLTWDELYKLIEDFNNKQYLGKDWTETTEETFYDMFECLPPLHYTQLKPNGFFFFISEATTGDIHAAYICYNKKYYSAMRSRFQKPVDLFSQLKIQLERT